MSVFWTELMRLYPSNALLTACISAFFMLLGVYYALPDVCPHCHDVIYTRKKWRVPASWCETHKLTAAMVRHPERILGAEPIWVCTNCDYGWTNPLNGQFLRYEKAPVNLDQREHPTIAASGSTVVR